MNDYELLDWLQECDGDTIWSKQHCLARGIPQLVVDKLTDAHESGFDCDSNTIFHDEKLVNQYEGIRDVDLAIWIGKQFGVDVKRILQRCMTRGSIVREIKEAIEEG